MNCEGGVVGLEVAGDTFRDLNIVGWFWQATLTSGTSEGYRSCQVISTFAKREISC